MSDNRPGISRRSFLGAAAITAIGAGTVSLGLSGCGASNDANTQSAETSSNRSWENPPASIPDSQIADTIDTDILVIGAGIAGVSTMLGASEAGAKAVCLEKTDGISARGLEAAAIGSKAQKEAGVEIDKNALINDIMQYSNFKTDQRLLNLWAEKSGGVFDDLIDMLAEESIPVGLDPLGIKTDGASFFRVYPTGHVFGTATAPVVDIKHMMESMRKRAETAGAQFVFSTPVQQLTTDDQGNVTGAIGQKDDGTYVKVNAAKGVVFATGDYGGNDEMINQWCPTVNEVDARLYTPAGANSGDGIDMAYWVGGEMQKGSAAPMIHPIFSGGELAGSSYMRVDHNGERFCNEELTLPALTNTYMNAPEHKVWAIFDNDYPNQYMKMSITSQYTQMTSGPLYAATGDLKSGASIEDAVNLSVEKGFAFKADSVADLARQIGVDATTLQASVDRYNVLGDEGTDEDFGKNAQDLFPIKTAPFYASAVTARLLVIASGINVDSNLQVKKATDGNPIGGLYAVGNAGGNYFANDYPLLAPGMSHGRCLVLGRLLGQGIATGTPIQQL